MHAHAQPAQHHSGHPVQHHGAHGHPVHQGAAPTLDFKFTFVRGGNAASVFAKDGMVCAEGIVLDGRRLPHQCILDTDTRDRRIVLTLDNLAWADPTLSEFVEDGFLVLEVRKPDARTVEKTIDRFASYLEAETKRQRLAAEGREHEFRTQTCPSCYATVDLSCLPQSEYYYCRFCSSVHHFAQAQPMADHYRTCDECAMFDRNQSYTEFYFYFLVLVYGFSVTRRHMCDNCARGLFWKAFLINFIFVLGVPSAIWIRLKSRIGREASLAQLADANAKALKGDARASQALFAGLHQVLPNHPGLHTNEARGYLEAGDAHSAYTSLQHALTACPNYLPAQALTQALSQ